MNAMPCRSSRSFPAIAANTTRPTGEIRRFLAKQLRGRTLFVGTGYLACNEACGLPHIRRRELLTAAGVLALPGLLVLLDAGASLRAEESEKRTWRLTVERDQPRLD
jgi:hypothetical protein